MRRRLNVIREPHFSTGFTPTTVLITINLIMYVYTSILSGSFLQTHITILRLLGQDNSRVLNGAWWQLFTAIFIHVNIMHLLSNMLFLLIFGIRAETLFTTTEYYAIYLLSGFTGNLLTLLLGSLSIVSAGASGAIFGLFGAVIIYMRKVIKAPVITALIFAILFFLATSLSPGINILAHFGGLVVGLLFGYLIASTREKSKNNYS